jgi:citrate lyase subunit beta/citryl-CoA lyase
MNSFLYVPANRPDRFSKAVNTGAHAVIVDLEDAVSTGDKEQARAHLAAQSAYLRSVCDARGTQLLVRINARATPWHDEDVRACTALDLHGIVVPKPDCALALGTLAGTLPGKDLYLLVETLRGFSNINSIAAAPAVSRMMFGTVDLMLDMGITDADMPLHHFRSLILMHSKLAGLAPPVDGVCAALEDGDALRGEIRRAQRFGFGAKLCVHPSQVDPINTLFSPSAEELAWARRVVNGSAHANGAAIKVEGQLVDAPVLEQARQLLARAR